MDDFLVPHHQITGACLERHEAVVRHVEVVGGHNVKKGQLVGVYESLGLTGVTTFIASGNVVFDKPSGSLAALEATAEKAFESALGYAAATFIRTPAQLKAIVRNRPFGGRGPETGATLHVGFLKQRPSAEQLEALKAYENDINQLDVTAQPCTG